MCGWFTLVNQVTGETIVDSSLIYIYIYMYISSAGLMSVERAVSLPALAENLSHL